MFCEVGILFEDGGYLSILKLSWEGSLSLYFICYVCNMRQNDRCRGLIYFSYNVTINSFKSCCDSVLIGRRELIPFYSVASLTYDSPDTLA